MLDLLKQYIIAEIENEIQKGAEMNINEEIYQILEKASKEEINEYIESGQGKIRRKAWNSLKVYIDDEILENIDRFARYVDIDYEEINDERIKEEIDIDSYIDSNMDYINNIDKDDEIIINYENEDDEIKNIFERDIYENN